jgi:hypothetical protein
MKNGDRRHALLRSEAVGALAVASRPVFISHRPCVVLLRRPASAPIDLSLSLASRSIGPCSAHVHSSARPPAATGSFRADTPSCAPK